MVTAELTDQRLAEAATPTPRCRIFSGSSSINAEWPSLRPPFERRRLWDRAFLDARFDRIGLEPTFDQAAFLDDPSVAELQQTD